ncbi:unnamed protein product [Natator depressus]
MESWLLKTVSTAKGSLHHATLWPTWRRLRHSRHSRPKSLPRAQIPKTWQFMISLHRQGLAPPTIANPLAVSFDCRSVGHLDPCRGFMAHRILEDWARTESNVRKTVTLQVLKQLVEVLPHICHSWVGRCEAELFKEAFLLAFFEPFQVSELVPSANGDSSGQVPKLHDMQWEGDSLQLKVHRSKTDQRGFTEAVFLHRSGEMNLHPVQALHTYVAQCQHSEGGPLFLHSDHSFLTKFQFVGVFQKQLLFLPPGEHASQLLLNRDFNSDYPVVHR